MTAWKLEFNGLDAQQEGLREALCTLGNGYFATRGAAEEEDADRVHYPGTYLAGGYNRSRSHVAGKIIENEDLVNWPNWLSLKFKVSGEDEWFQLKNSQILKYSKELDMTRGILVREVFFIDEKGKKTRLKSSRLISMEDPHMAGIQWEFEPLNWSGEIVVKSALDAGVRNRGVDRYRDLNDQHLELLEKGEISEGGVYLLVQTNQSHLVMAQAARCKVYTGDEELEVNREVVQEEEQIAEMISLPVTLGETSIIEKILALFTSKDEAITEPKTEALESIERAERFHVLEQKHALAWLRLWRRFDVTLSAPEDSQVLLRLQLFHLLQTCSVHSIGKDVGVPARGWHGEAYRGHIFWDELFIFPLFNFRMPDLTRSLLLYRYNRLKKARQLAQKAGLQGAMFPWQSGSNGREESQVVHLNPASGRWVPDNTYLQRHVNLAIAYNVWHYYEITGDLDFMKFYGTELLLEVARFFASITTWNYEKQRFEIINVVGPDEFHTAYPGSKQPGINNNAYTNVMVSWLFSHALKSIGLLGEAREEELIKKLEIRQEEFSSWREISQKLFVPFFEDGTIAQFEGYDQLKELDWDAYRKKYGNIQRLDRILEAEGDSINSYKASKQADVLMLFYLFSSEELVEQFQRMGYAFDPAQIPENVKYYLERTSDGSTLSRVVRSWVEARSDRDCSWHCFRQALVSDFSDVQGGTTAEGIHLGSMAGTVDILQRAFTGLEVREDALWLNPSFPKEVESMTIKLYYRGIWLQLEFDQKQCKLTAKDGISRPIELRFRGNKAEIKPGTVQTFDYEVPKVVDHE